MVAEDQRDRIGSEHGEPDDGRESQCRAHADDTEIRLSKGGQVVLEAGERQQRDLGEGHDRPLRDQVDGSPGRAIDADGRDADHPTDDDVLHPHEGDDEQLGQCDARAQAGHFPEDGERIPPPREPPVSLPGHRSAGDLDHRALHHQTPWPPASPGGRKRGRAAQHTAHHRSRRHGLVAELSQHQRDVGRPQRGDREDGTQCRQQWSDRWLSQSRGE